MRLDHFSELNPITRNIICVMMRQKNVLEKNLLQNECYGNFYLENNTSDFETNSSNI